MASNFSDEEREERIIIVGEFFINNPTVSIREATAYFNTNLFKISIATVHDYLNRYKIIVNNKRDEIEEHMNNNKPLTVENAEVRKRVSLVSNMYLYEGYTVEQISEILNKSFFTIYRDLTKRLKIVDEELYDLVKSRMKDKIQENLTKKK